MPQKVDPGVGSIPSTGLEALFQPIKGLPTDRGVGHTIPLRSGRKPPLNLPYTLSPVETEEVEKQVRQLLSLGLTEPS